MSIASTVVLIKNLADAGLGHTEGGRIATGWLIVEDLVTVVVLVVLPVLFGPGEVDAAAVAAGLGMALVKTAVFVALMFAVGSRVLPRMLIRIARPRSRRRACCSGRRATSCRWKRVQCRKNW